MRFVIVEVGTTSAEKLAAYLQCKDIGEVRWYTRCGEDGVCLVGQWFHEAAPVVRIERKTVDIKIMERDSRRGEEETRRRLRDKRLSFDSYTACLGCGRPLQLKHMVPMDYHGREYIVCEVCRQEGRFLTHGELHSLIAGYFGPSLKEVIQQSA